MPDARYDIAVLGSGFGGSLAALLFTRLGLRTALLDRTAHPRFAIGESSTPLADFILRDLAARYDLPRLAPLAAYGPWQEHYPHLVAGRKRGFSYFYHTAGQALRPTPDHAGALLVAASADPYHSDTHWLRADVDAFLAAEARAAGGFCLDNTPVEITGGGPPWVLSAGALRIEADFLLDATGAGGVLPRALGVDDAAHPFLTHSRALFSHFDGVASWNDVWTAAGGDTRDHPFPCDEAALHHVFDGGWMWMLRFNTGRVSAGFVLDGRRHPPDERLSPEAEWTAWLSRFPALQAQFAAAKVTSPPGRILRTGRLQRRVARAAGPGWALLPFTAGFIDPLHSTGIAHTLHALEHLAGLFEAHRGTPALDDALADYSARLLRELDFVDRLVASCYEAAFDFRAYTAAAMVYFAASVCAEQARLRGRRGAFLGADDDGLYGIAGAVRARARGLRAAPDVAAFAAFVEEALEPYNTVGLFRPAVPNMYRHTAPRTPARQTER